jgi:hypothetical protein
MLKLPPAHHLALIHTSVKILYTAPNNVKADLFHYSVNSLP